MEMDSSKRELWGGAPTKGMSGKKASPGNAEWEKYEGSEPSEVQRHSSSKKT